MIETLSTQVLYENRWMRLKEDRIRRDNGQEGIYAFLEKSHAAVIVPWDGERLTLVKQHRYTIHRSVWELPMGAVESGAISPEETAAQELREETGLIAGKMTRLGLLYFAYGMSSQPFTAFLAEDLVQGPDSLEPEEQGLEVGRFTLEEVHELIRTGEMVDAATLATFYLWRGMA